MENRAEVYRRAAAECLELARGTPDLATRAVLLTLAQDWLQLANRAFADRQLDAALQEFNDEQMIHR